MSQSALSRLVSRSHGPVAADAFRPAMAELDWSADAVRDVAAHGAGASLVEIAAAGETQALIVCGSADAGGAARVALGYSREAPYTVHWGPESVALLEPAR